MWPRSIRFLCPMNYIKQHKDGEIQSKEERKASLSIDSSSLITTLGYIHIYPIYYIHNIYIISMTIINNVDEIRIEFFSV